LTDLMRKGIGASWKVEKKRGVRLNKPDAPPCKSYSRKSD
jgi:hypothetical protein